MYPSGTWHGFWEQKEFGRQPMQEFRLRFRDGAVDGDGKDIIGPFVFRGEYDETTGQVRMVKQYLGRHRVVYEGAPDGEGSIAGIWSIPDWDGTVGWTGPFLLRPVIARPTGEEAIEEVVK